MAVLSKCASPGCVKIEVYKLESIVVRWIPPEDATGKYSLCVEYFDPHGPMISPFWTTEQEVSALDTAKEFRHPEEARDGPGGLRACTVRATIAPVGSPPSKGEAATCQTTWDSKQSDDEAIRRDRDKHMAVLCTTLEEYQQKKKTSELQVLVVGRQHHGKSSFINHLHRSVLGRLDCPDEMESAPAGMAENTLETKSSVLCFPHDGFRHCIRFVDTPAFSSLESIDQNFEALLESSFRDGTRRHQMTHNDSLPADAAICVLSLMQWVSMKKEQQTFLQTIAHKFKSASGGRVSFPFVVAVTHRDEFLKETTADNPMKQLREIVHEIKDHANTQAVFVLANMKRTMSETDANPPYWSKDVSLQTFELLRSVVTFAKNANTGVVKQEKKESREKVAFCFLLGPFVLLAFLMVVVVVLVALAETVRRR